MFNKNDKFTNYLSPAEIKRLNEVLENAAKNAQTISELKRRTGLKRRTITGPSFLGYDQERIQHETELGYRIINELEKKATDRKKREQSLKVRAATVNADILRSIKEEYQSERTERKQNKEHYQTH